jgi:dolichol kinase
MLGFVFLYPLLGKWGMAGVAGFAFLMNVLVLPRTPIGKRMKREGERPFAGMQTYPLAVALGWVLFPPEIAALAWALLAVGDPAAAMMGAPMKDRKALRVPWNPRKSVVGMGGFIIFGEIAAWLIASWIGLEGTEKQISTVTGGAAVAAALAESIPWPFDDNIPILLAAGAGALGVVALA